MNDHYQVLGVARDASQEEITRRYRFLVQVYHPDRFQESAAKLEAEEEMKKINVAYSILSNPQKRAEYDRESTVRNGSSYSNKRRDEDGNNAETDPIVDYLLSIREKWIPKIQPLLKDKRISESVNLIQGGFFLLLKNAYPEKDLEDVRHITDQIDQSIVILVFLSLSLGAELYKNNLPKGYTLNAVEELICSPLHSLAYETTREIQKRGSWTEETEKYLEGTWKIIAATCRMCQEIGNDFAENEAISTSGNVDREKPPASRDFTGKSYENTPSSDSQQVRETERLGICQSCMRLAETRKVHFNQNIGILVRRFHKSLEGYLCADCIEKYFWEFTGKTLLFGWWGIISLIVTPFFLLGNLGQYWGSRHLRQYAGDLGSIAKGWKTVSFFSIVGLVFLLYWFIQPYYQSPYSSTAYSSPTSTPYRLSIPTATKIPYRQPTSTAAVYRRPTPTKQSCYQWSEITTQDEGSSICVKGIVRDAYWGDENRFFMTFGENTSSFRFIVLGGYYYKDVEGKCVLAQGEVKIFGSMPYMEVTNNLFICE